MKSAIEQTEHLERDRKARVAYGAWVVCTKPSKPGGTLVLAKSGPNAHGSGCRRSEYFPTAAWLHVE
jgi:hypothetical protein